MVIYGAGSLRKNYSEGNERQWLPKLRNFKPDKESEKRRARSGKKTAESALHRVVTKDRQLGCEIKRSAEQWQSQETRA
jgi:hypothetical protein